MLCTASAFLTLLFLGYTVIGTMAWLGKKLWVNRTNVSIMAYNVYNFPETGYQSLATRFSYKNK